MGVMQDSLLVTLLRAIVPDLTPTLVRMIEDHPFQQTLWSDIPLPKGEHTQNPLQRVLNNYMSRTIYISHVPMGIHNAQDTAASCRLKID